MKPDENNLNVITGCRKEKARVLLWRTHSCDHLEEDIMLVAAQNEMLNYIPPQVLRLIGQYLLFIISHVHPPDELPQITSERHLSEIFWN